MAIPVIMPRQGQSVESCIITKWHKRIGEAVKPGETLFSYETDKAAFDEEARDAGTLLAILREAGDDVPCLENVCVIGEPGEDVRAFLSGTPVAEETEHAPVKEAVAAPVAVEASKPMEGKISPRARALAARSGVDISQAGASGPNGRVIERDIQALIDAGKIATPAAREAGVTAAEGTGLGGRVSVLDAGKQAEPAPVIEQSAPIKQAVAETRDEPLSHIRKVIAKTMQASLSSMAQLTHNATFDATAILALRKRFKEQGEAYGMAGVTLGDIIVYAASRTLTQPEHAHLNANLLGDTMRYFTNVQMGVAVDTPRGLMVPTLRDANLKSLLQISIETKALAKACVSGAIDPDLLTGGSFTVSNLGAVECEHFTPVINPPQTGILGVNTIQQRVREADGKIEVYPAMTLSLTYDHRALDGAPASRFLRDLKRNLEHIDMLLGGGAFHV